MKPTILVVSGALALGLLAGCDRKPEEGTRANTTTYQTGSSAAGGGTAVQQSNEQRKDFQQRGDGAGPKPGG